MKGGEKMNYQALPRDKKAVLKPLVSEIRKQLYANANISNVPMLIEGLVVNFGKRAETRFTVKVQIVA